MIVLYVLAVLVVVALLGLAASVRILKQYEPAAHSNGAPVPSA